MTQYNGHIAICTNSPDLIPNAQQIATTLGLPLVPPYTTDYPILLTITASRIELCLAQEKNIKPICADFTQGTFNHRLLFGGGKKELIAKAIGLKGKHCPSVLDLTAGLGQDAFRLATLGCKVTMLERNPIIATLLRDSLHQIKEKPNFQNLDLTFIETDALHYLKSAHTQADVIYLDPMYPKNKKTALVRKEMRVLRYIVGPDYDTPTLLEAALHHAKHRVVIKRPRTLRNTPGLKRPDVHYYGQSTRFDVYLKTASN